MVCHAKPTAEDRADFLLRSGFGSIDYTELHPDTDPEAIADRHRDEVRKAYRAGTRDPKALSELLTLPLWNVQRALEDLGLYEFVKSEKVTQAAALPILIECVTNNPDKTMIELHKLSGLSRSTVYAILNGTSGRFTKEPNPRRRGTWMWRIRERKTIGTVVSG